MNSRPTVGSFFSGIGGMDAGFEQAGFDILWANECDKPQAEIFEMNFPNTELYKESIHMISSDDLVEAHGSPDVLIGGFPCVTYSNAANIHGKRHVDSNPKRNYAKYAKDGGDLFLHMRRMIGDIQPSAFVIENVMELQGCRIVMETLKNTPCSLTGEKLGRYYHLVYGEVVTSDFGVAQNRKRMFVMGINRKAEKPVLEKQPMDMTHTIGKILEENPNVPPYSGEMPQYIINRLEGKYRQKTAIKPSSAEVIGNTCLAHYAGDQSTQMVLREDGEITPYSVREYANMQGFPPGFKLIDRKKTYRGIGNAVSVPVAKAVADALMPLL